MKANNYRYSLQRLFFDYQKDKIDKEALIETLIEYEEQAKDEYSISDDEVGFSIRFGDMSIVYTIHNIDGDLSLPSSHPNRKLLEEVMKESYQLEPDFELEIELL